MSEPRITRLSDAAPYIALLHQGVGTLRLQGHEAGPTQRFWVGLSYYLPGGGAQMAPTQEETVYVVLDGELTLTTGGGRDVLGPYDSVHLPRGLQRQIDNHTNRPATLLVIIAHPAQES